MVAYADTGFLVSLYLKESTSVRARASIQAYAVPLPITPLGMLELRNALNLAVKWRRITTAERDTIWQDVETDIAGGFLQQTPMASAELHAKARELSDRYTPTVGTRSLDLLHVAAALLLEAETFFSFDERQRQAALGEGLEVKP